MGIRTMLRSLDPVMVQSQYNMSRDMRINGPIILPRLLAKMKSEMATRLAALEQAKKIARGASRRVLGRIAGSSKDRLRQKGMGRGIESLKATTNQCGASREVVDAPPPLRSYC